MAFCRNSGDAVTRRNSFPRESVRIGFTQLKLPELISFTQVTNLASRRVMEKAGFHYERDFTYANTPHVLYRQPAPAT